AGVGGAGGGGGGVAGRGRRARPRRPGGGAPRRGARPRRRPQPARLDQATLSTGFPSDAADTRVNFDHFTNLLTSVARIRLMGSAALNLAAVALGQMEGYWEVGPKAWDFAAGTLLVEEAGGRVTDLRGRGLDLHGRQMLATNGLIHDQLVAALARGHSGLG